LKREIGEAANKNKGVCRWLTDLRGKKAFKNVQFWGCHNEKWIK
jgi:hypothetical protein